jgi:putative transposase
MRVLRPALSRKPGRELRAYWTGCRHGSALLPSSSLSARDHLAATWLYLRFTLRYRDVEELLAERELDSSYETVRRWVLKFGPTIARRLRQRRPRPSNCWHLDEMVCASPASGCICGAPSLVQRRRDSWAALRLMCKLLKKQGFVLKLPVTDKLHSYACAFRRLRLTCQHEQGLRINYRADNSH